LRIGERRTTQIYDEFLAGAGVRITQFGLLAHLEISKAPCEYLRAAELSMDPTTLNRNLKPLEKRRLVRSTISSKDRRAREIVLTAAGREVLCGVLRRSGKQPTSM
jgi:DNA-binding MarR family transcriptional regulator